MTKVAYLECPTGIAGDMCLGALVDAGVPVEYLVEQLSRLGLSHEYKLRAEKVLRNSQQATQIHVELSLQANQSPHLMAVHHSDPSSSHEHSHHHDDRSPHPEHLSQPDPALHHPHDHHPHHPHPHGTRHLPEIEALIQTAHLPKRVETWSLAVFRQLAAAEGAVHGISPNDVHFHEVGATDAIVDIVGTCLGLDWLNVDELYCSSLPTGGGMVRAAHGLLPVPAPAVLKLWQMRQVPIYSNGIQRELVTPTGAAIVTTLATEFGSPPPMLLQQVGLGAGSRNLEIPNILRLWIGEPGEGNGAIGKGQSASLSNPTQNPMQVESASPAPASAAQPFSSSTHQLISVLETQIDDLSPQAIGYLFEVLFAAGALDVFTQPVGMKKSRMGVLLTVVCHPEQADACEAVIFQETTTLGIRRSVQQRSVLPRKMQVVETPYGTVQMKVTDRGNKATMTNAHPEYEDCARLAKQAHVPWQEVHRLALHCWYETAYRKPD